MPSVTEQVAGTLREKIVQGRWTPGTQLPPRVKLASDLGTCQATLQEAVSLLVAEGFVEVGARKTGTRVAAAPPHLTRYRLIFPFGQDDWGQFWHALEEAAQARTTPTREFPCFYGLAGHRDIADFEAVVNEVRTKSVAGLIFASSANELVGTPLLDAPGVPRVALAGKWYLPGVPKVALDLDGFMEQAVDSLLTQGRRRIALLCASVAGEFPEIFRRALAARGLSTRKSWIQFASQRNPQAARQVMELMFDAGQAERPDGLIVADDNLLTAATEGLVAAGVRVPACGEPCRAGELQVVSATNFPHLLPSAVPVTRIGFDIPAVLDLLVQRLEEVRRGETPPENTSVPAIHESKVTNSRMVRPNSTEDM
jgi:DNA-binding LacI/PurR family transcriptional regulator